MGTPSKSVNAWIFLEEDEPSGTSYLSPNSCYQSLIDYGVYNSTDMVSICWVNTLPTSSTTVPPGDGSSYTVQLQTKTHPDGSSNQQYMDWLIQDSRSCKTPFTYTAPQGQSIVAFSGSIVQVPWQVAARRTSLSPTYTS